MSLPQCNHDRKYWVKRIRLVKRIRIDDENAQSTAVPPKIQRLHNQNDFSLSRETQEKNRQKKVESTLNKSGVNAVSSNSVNTRPTAARLAETDKLSSDIKLPVVQQNADATDGSAVNSAEHMVPRNRSLPQTPTSKIKKEDLIFVDEEDAIWITETMSYVDEKPNVATNTVTSSKNVDVITLDSDTDDDMSDVTNMSKIQAKVADEIASSSSDDTTSSDDSSTEAVPAISPHATVKAETSVAENTVSQSIDGASSTDIKYVQETTVTSPTATTAHHSRMSSNGNEKPPKDVTRVNAAPKIKDHVPTHEKSRVSSNATPNRTRTVNNPAIDRLITSITGIASSLGSILTSQSEDIFGTDGHHESTQASTSTTCAQEITVTSSAKTTTSKQKNVQRSDQKTVVGIPKRNDALSSKSDEMKRKESQAYSNNKSAVARTVTNPAIDLLMTSVTSIVSSSKSYDSARIKHPHVPATTSSKDSTIVSQNVPPKVTSQFKSPTSSASTKVDSQNPPPKLTTQITNAAIAEPADFHNNSNNEQNKDNERTLTHYLKSRNDIPQMELDEHRDALSYYVAGRKHESLRGPEVIDNLLPTEIDASKSFNILSYNVLSQAKIEKNRHLYPKIKDFPEMFGWNYRWRLLSIELDRFHADICCLQEIERNKVEKFYHPKMVGAKGYKSFYAWKKESGDSDGCAIYWNPKKFDKIEEIIIPLNNKIPHFAKANVAQILHLKHKMTGKELIIVNTQLVNDRKSGADKLFQLAVIFANLHKVRTNNQSIIFCGDFGLKPSSLLHKFITDGEIDFTKENRTTIDGLSRREKRIENFTIPVASRISNNCTFIGNDETDGGTTRKMRHPFNLESVYGKKTFVGNLVLSAFHHEKSNRENEITNYGNPDYIFYSIKEKINVKDKKHDVIEKELFLHQRLSLPDKESLEDFVKLTPHDITGSDHLPLYAEFFFA